MWKSKKSQPQMEYMFEEITKDVENRLKDLSFSYEKIGRVLEQTPSCGWKLEEGEIKTILGKLSVEACSDCENFYLCYRRQPELLLAEVRTMVRQMEREGTGTRICVPDSFHGRCLRETVFVRELICFYEVVSTRKIWWNKMIDQRKALASQMKELSKVLYGCGELFGYVEKKETDEERKIKKQLSREKIRVKRIRFLENPWKKREVFLLAEAKKSNYPTEKLAKKLSRAINKPMIPAKDCKLSVYRTPTCLHFEEDSSYFLLSGIAIRPKEKNGVCGDVFSNIRLKHDRQVCILADGMGVGETAAKESRRLVELMEQMLESGFPEEETVRLANLAVAFGEERSAFTSFDLLSFHLHTGFLKMVKAGSAATFIIRKRKVEMIPSKTPPSGLFWEVEFDVLYKKLYDGDIIVLMSDGVLERLAGKGKNPEQILTDMLPSLCGENPQNTAERILSWVWQQEGNVEDDMSVLVLSLWKKSHG